MLYDLQMQHHLLSSFTLINNILMGNYYNSTTNTITLQTIGTCGMTEPKAIEKYGEDNVKVYKSKFSNLFYGIFDMKPEDKPKTLMKVICAGVDEKVVGIHVLGMGADEMMQVSISCIVL